MDNGLTPQLLVDAGVDGIVIPEGYVRDGKMVLNVHTQAVKALLGMPNLSLGNKGAAKAASSRRRKKKGRNQIKQPGAKR